MTSPGFLVNTMFDDGNDDQAKVEARLSSGTMMKISLALNERLHSNSKVLLNPYVLNFSEGT